MPLNDESSVLPGVILDTNAVLDWLVFRDPGMACWAGAIEHRRLRWLSCTAMRDELQHTLGYRQLARWQPDATQVMASFDRLSITCGPPAPTGLPGLSCSDPDDQVFIDLGLVQRARWLVTHDRALLRLARAAGRAGLHVVRPAAGEAVLAAA